MCLKHYDYNTADVINAVLEYTLPSHLSELDFSLPYIPPNPEVFIKHFNNKFSLNRHIYFDNVSYRKHLRPLWITILVSKDLTYLITMNLTL